MSISRSFAISCAAASDVGRVRKNNEDAALSRPDIGLWVVADGMGGHEAGEVASGLIVQSLADMPPPADFDSFIAGVRARLEAANAQLFAEAERRGPNTVIGSTVVALLVGDETFACLWAGDCRLYRYRSGELMRISRDHSQVQDLIDAGQLSEADAEHHRLANVITRAIGALAAVEIASLADRVEPGDLFLLCSDGLTKMIADTDIAAIVSITPVKALPQALIDAALERGGRDNVTVAAVECRALPERAPE